MILDKRAEQYNVVTYVTVQMKFEEFDWICGGKVLGKVVADGVRLDGRNAAWWNAIGLK